MLIPLQSFSRTRCPNGSKLMVRDASAQSRWRKSHGGRDEASWSRERSHSSHRGPSVPPSAQPVATRWVIIHGSDIDHRYLHPGRQGLAIMFAIVRLFVAISLLIGAWRRYKDMGEPVLFEGRRYWQCADGMFRRWYGGRGKTAAMLGVPDRPDDPGVVRPIPPIHHDGRTYYPCEDGLYRRWYGGRGRTVDELTAVRRDAA
jgi:hypothetical protein